MGVCVGRKGILCERERNMCIPWISVCACAKTERKAEIWHERCNILMCVGPEVSTRHRDSVIPH